MNVEPLRVGFPTIGATRVGLAGLICQLGWTELAELRARAPSWAPVVADAVQRAVDRAVDQRRGAEARGQLVGGRRRSAWLSGRAANLRPHCHAT
jgi:hypothetical protein